MGDMKEDFEFLKSVREGRRQNRMKMNLEILNRSGKRWLERNNGSVFLFREQNGIKADFYPGTGRWRSQGKTCRGGARAFLKWLNNNG